MSKKLNEAVIQNELKQGSAFFKPKTVANKKEPKNERSNERSLQRTDDRTDKRSTERTNERSDKPASEQLNDRTLQKSANQTENRNLQKSTTQHKSPIVKNSDDKQTAKREKTRHSFDIYADQLRTMQSIQLQTVQSGSSKPTLGEMVQAAIDDYLGKRKKRTDERTFEPSN